MSKQPKRVGRPILDLIGPHVVDLADAAFVNRDAPIAYDATVIPAWSPVGIEEGLKASECLYHGEDHIEGR